MINLFNLLNSYSYGHTSSGFDDFFNAFTGISAVITILSIIASIAIPVIVVVIIVKHFSQKNDSTTSTNSTDSNSPSFTETVKNAIDNLSESVTGKSTNPNKNSKKCPYCGAKHKADENRCPNCGAHF